MSIGDKVLPRVSENSRKYVNEVLDYGFHNTTSTGFCGRLEKEFAAKFGTRYAILHSNGTATMHSALIAADVGVGDEVIVPGRTMASTALVALYVNAIPILADIDPDTFTISVEDIRRKITPRTKAIIPVAIDGLACDMDPIMELAKEHNLTVIEDNAQCFLGYYKDRLVGTIGDFASFSFQGSKHMTCGDGGILTTNDPELALKARKAAVLGYSAISAEPGAIGIPEEIRCMPSFARHTCLGYNFRIPEIAAAAALGDLERLDELVEMRTESAKLIAEVVKNCKWMTPQKTPDGYVHSYWSYTVKLEEGAPDWLEFRKKFVEIHGDGFYASLLSLNLEPVFIELSKKVAENPKRYPQWAGLLPDYSQVRLPVLEDIQPRMVQFKTNHFSIAEAKKHADALAKTIAFFS
ncbi:DegT/DnrJ/EryC1/StrS family aminotransferase [Planctomycetota bacterium]